MPRILITNDDGIYSEGIRKLADALRDDQRAVRVHWEFHCYVIATLPRHLQWQLTQEQVITAAHEIEENAVAG